MKIERDAMVWKAVALGAGAAAGFGVNQVLGMAWRKVTDEPPPVDAADRTVGWKPAVVWAVTTGALMGVARLLAARSAARVWELATDAPPPISERQAS